MATDLAVHTYRTWYSVLLRLYPRPFRQRFGEAMAQTFHDLCRERSQANGSLFGLVVWVFCETLMGIVRENIMQMSELGKTTLRVALVALGLVMVPLVASRLIEGWNWHPGAFVVVYFLFFATGMIYALIARRMGARTYKAGVGLAMAAGLALGWSTMVQVADSGHPENLVYQSVLVVGLVGAGLSRLRAKGLALTLFAMATTLALISLALPSGLPSEQARNMFIGHCVYVMLFITAGVLLRRASLVDAPRQTSEVSR